MPVILPCPMCRVSSSFSLEQYYVQKAVSCPLCGGIISTSSDPVSSAVAGSQTRRNEDAPSNETTQRKKDVTYVSDDEDEIGDYFGPEPYVERAYTEEEERRNGIRLREAATIGTLRRKSPNHQFLRCSNCNAELSRNMDICPWCQFDLRSAALRTKAFWNAGKIILVVIACMYFYWRWPDYSRPSAYIGTWVSGVNDRDTNDNPYDSMFLINIKADNTFQVKVKERGSDQWTDYTSGVWKLTKITIAPSHNLEPGIDLDGMGGIFYDNNFHVQYLHGDVRSFESAGKSYDQEFR